MPHIPELVQEFVAEMFKRGVAAIPSRDARTVTVCLGKNCRTVNPGSVEPDDVIDIMNPFTDLNEN